MHMWPRNEVLQLLIPQLSARASAPSSALICDLVRQLSKAQSAEGKVSFDRWLVAAKEHLKWNDSCIKLFWDMLGVATFYFHSESDASDMTAPGREDRTCVELELLVIFIVLHVSEPQRPQSPSVVYDAVWPGVEAAGAQYGLELDR